MPIADGEAFEKATVPALAEFDATEPGTLAYLLCKRPDGSTYHFIEMFKDQAALDTHGGSDAFKAMAGRQKEAKANDRSRKAAFDVGMTLCVNTTRRAVTAAEAAAKSAKL